jgi:hypothetical protein
MKTEKIKSDPLLEEEESLALETNEQVGKLEKTVSNDDSIQPDKVILSDSAKIKAEALAKFPNDIVSQTKYILDNSEHISFIIPLNEGDAVGSAETTQINGYRLTIQKGVMVNIPKQVAYLLAEKYRIAMTAGQDKRIDRASEITEALG